jgi:hypothetical protein
LQANTSRLQSLDSCNADCYWITAIKALQGNCLLDKASGVSLRQAARDTRYIVVGKSTKSQSILPFHRKSIDGMSGKKLTQSQK